MEFSQLRADFELLDDWEDKYRYLIDLGDELAPLSDDEKVRANKVSGCVSQVWLVQEKDERGRFVFRGTSDAHIVRGLIAVLLALFSHKSAEDILALDAYHAFQHLGLEAHLTPQRSNGFFAMVEKVKSTALASSRASSRTS